jgi:hypothetical protein
MTSTASPIKIAILDDYQNVALKMADWSPLRSRSSIEAFQDTISNPDDLVARLLPFDVICVMRERTPLPRSIIERLPQLKLIVSISHWKQLLCALEAGSKRWVTSLRGRRWASWVWDG